MGWNELLIIIVIAMVVIGPARMPEYAPKLARGIRQLRVMADGAKAQLKEQMGPEFEDVNWRQYDPRQYDPRRWRRHGIRSPPKSRRCVIRRRESTRRGMRPQAWLLLRLSRRRSTSTRPSRPGGRIPTAATRPLCVRAGARAIQCGVPEPLS